MKDPRIVKIAKNLVNYSTKVKPGENVLIEYKDDTPLPLVHALIDEIKAAGGRAFVNHTDMQLQRRLLKAADDEWFDTMREVDLLRMKKMQAYIAINGRNNSFELSDVPPEQMKKNTQKYVIPVHFEQRVAHTKWCILAFPNPSYAQASSMSTEAFEDFYCNVCSVDYAKMDKAMDPLKELMDKTDKVRLLGPGRTDLTFSIKGLPGVKCSGEYNIPDGEVFTAPVKDSVNGVIEYNTPSAYNGTRFDKVILTFEKGKIVKIEGSNVEKLEEIFNTDEGARYVGEFAIGVNPYVTKPMVDILFDEKICGSIHFTPGATYDECDNGNQSGIHWDLVMIQTPEYGGGEIYFDDVLIRKDGQFVLDELKALNPENLK
ncbi:aminopeptidase [bacterium]|nr:aminopeptidase [bacterium]